MGGIKCQRWNSPKLRTYKYRYLPENYCRNPSKDAGPWCYTMKPITGSSGSTRDWDLCFTDCSVIDCYDSTRKCFHYGKTHCALDLYNGTQSNTVHGIKCQEWSSDKPHSHDYKHYPRNYCRNPNGMKGPWCFTTDPKTKWDYCFPHCSVNDCYDGSRKCFHYGKAGCNRDLYMGSQSYTVYGTKCQEWSSDNPHPHDYKNLPNNYCRNPDGEKGPWCYTMNPKQKWEYCFTDCSANNCGSDKGNCFYYGKAGCNKPFLYNGTRSYTRDGIKCQEWSANKPKPHKYNYLPKNYCRNPDGEDGPWCYTTKPIKSLNGNQKNWDYCLTDCTADTCFDVSRLCFYRGKPGCTKPYAYNGTRNFNLDRNTDGKSCLKWSLAGSNHLPDNYCRNPNGRLAPWCYTVKNQATTKWNFCFDDCYVPKHCKVRCYIRLRACWLEFPRCNAIERRKKCIQDCVNGGPEVKSGVKDRSNNERRS